MVKFGGIPLKRLSVIKRWYGRRSMLMSGYPSRRAGLSDLAVRARPAFAAITIFTVSGVLSLSAPVRAETISSALSKAYTGNPDLNQQRAAGRASDENVSRAVSGYRPTAAVTASYGYNQINGSLSNVHVSGPSAPSTAGITVTENLFNGFQTLNSVRQAESGVLQSRETTRFTEENTLLNGATAYMNVLRDTAILELNKNNITVLEEQLRQTRDRFKVGEVTRTDVAQAESSLATVYRQTIGVEPTRLEPARPIDALLPHALPEAISLALAEHPSIKAALHNVDAASAQVKIYEGQLYPSLNVVGSFENNTAYNGIPSSRFWNGSILGQLSVPIYSGGATYSLIRQAKELLSQAELQSDVQRDSVRSNVVSTWAVLVTTKAVILSSQAAVKSAEIALDGVREEAKVGQRTTLDVLMAQQTLLSARVTLVSAQRDRVVASYAVMAAVGQLSAQNLSLDVTHYDPKVHYLQVRDKWIGLRTPDGR
jgi:outer membrane protein